MLSKVKLISKTAHGVKRAASDANGDESDEEEKNENDELLDINLSTTSKLITNGLRDVTNLEASCQSVVGNTVVGYSEARAQVSITQTQNRR